MSKEPYDSVAWGGKLGDEHEEGWLGDCDSHARAYPGRVAEARRHFPEIDFDSLDVIRTGPDKWLLIDGDGVEYRSCGADALQRPDPAHQQIAGFTIDDAGFLHFLRRRGDHGLPTSVVDHGAVTWRKVS